ncbi:hypothetical protein QQZ08_002152 [Neonectria magnoliae]|uniref:C2H2-type domain-containing protein n=1 Tax=Neonectria magnoliae TaxID=2732573 RepID=A0ABR1ICX1_9HYPO
MTSGRLDGKVAIITGAASGFGKGIATKFVHEGCKVLIADLSEEAGMAAAKELGCSFKKADVTKKADWEALWSETLSVFGQLDIVVNNAGATYANKPTEDVTESEFDLVMNVNVKSIFMSTAVLLQYFLKESRAGCFIQVASTAAIRPRPRLTWYNASKSAVVNATKTLAVEYGPKQIRFNVVSPVVGSTGMTHLFLGKADTPENREAFVATVPLGRPSTPVDVANACCYLASDEAGFITGTNIEHARAALSCNQCDRSFSRPSHLNRHRLTHLPPSRRNTIPCLCCDQTFSRKDVLLRHLRAAHHVDLPSTSSQQKSCYRCVRRKLRCDRALPCRSCAIATTAESCSYPPIDPAFGAASQLLEQRYDASHTIQATSDAASRGTDHSDYTTASPEKYSNLAQPLDPLLLNANELNPVFSGGPAVPAESTLFGTSLGNRVQFDFRCGGFDWLEFDAPDVELAIDCVVGDVPIPASTSTMHGSLFNHSTNLIPTLQPKSSVLPWPFEQGQETVSARCPLPPLREVLQKSLQTSSGTKTAALEGLVQILSEQKLPRPEDVTEPNMFLGIDLLKRLLDVYFSGFQTIQPIFHTPTWNMADCPTMLLATMACIGAVLSSEPNAAELSSSIRCI